MNKSRFTLNRTRGAHRIKTAALALCLGMCFMLTACYIAPDDINENNNMNTGVGNLPFQTLAPTATVEITPDVVVIETQNIYGPNGQILTTNTAMDTPAPTSDTGGSWNDWGSTPYVPGAQTPTPEGSFQLPTATPAPGYPGVTATPDNGTIQVVTAAPATPTVTPKSLQVGFKNSDEVRALQKKLKELGYYNGSVDGDYGTGTEKAVRAFQKANGLSADGKAGKQTLEKLNSRDAVSKKESEATRTPAKTNKPTNKPTAKPTATPNLTKEYYLQLGSSGKNVKTLQNRLIELGWLSGKATGTYDESTKAAVTAFQKKTKGLYDDGVAGPDTLKALYSANAARSSGAVAGTGQTLERGSEGQAVRTLQKRLKDLGYYKGSVDGSYGTSTEAAVIAFQKMNGLTPDGKAGTATQNKIYSDDAKKSGSTSKEIDTKHTTGKDTAGIASTGYVTLQNGASGADVKKLQQKLKDLGYYAGSVDGNFGDGTEAAVMAYQLKNNLTVDGKAGPATQRAIYGSKGSIAYSALRPGEKSSAVRNLQYTLYELGYYDGAIDGSYGNTTSDAVRAFQIQNKLTPVDGIAGSATLSRLYSADAKTATDAVVEYETARPGDKGELVVEIQDCLVQMGYLSKITGVYDDKTTAAIKKFQKDQKITADGVAGMKTLQLLFGY